MSKTTTIMMWAAVVLLIGVYFFPLWAIHLEAPQYPQGLGILIWIDEITGREPHDLQNINGLNHYIGMHAIEPDAIPELQYMKFFLAGLIAFAAVVALVRKRWLLAAWVIVAMVLAGMGMYDFWKWEYNYGHDLDPAAAIKIPGMSYQPPMFGTKQLLNFQTTAWPALGGLAAMLAVGLGVLALAWEIWKGRRHGDARGAQAGDGPRGSSARSGGAKVATAVMTIALVSAGCNTGPQPIAYDEDGCVYCRMTISDERYGTEIVTKKGRALKYDSIECLVHQLSEGDVVTMDEVAGVYVTNFTTPRALIDATGAHFLHSRQMPSPMGEFLTAFGSRATAESLHREKGGELHTWQGVMELLED